MSYLIRRQAARVAIVLSLVASFASAQAPASSAQASAPATLDIQIDKPLHTVSPMLYGLMTEEINYSYDGGLYAEMVRNRSFHDHGFGGIAQWNLVELGSGRADISIDRANGPSADVPSSMVLDVKQADAANPAGVRNEGYWGMAVRPDTTYAASFYARAETADSGPVHVALVSDVTGKSVAEASSAPLTTEWKKYDLTLRSGKLEPSKLNHLELTLTHPGKVYLQIVSVMPPTYKNRANGNRPDIMELLAAMHPRFLRLPGGNYLEGDTVDERFDWKATLGPLVNRPTHRSPWKYQSTDGMGLLEFLEWTEDLKMEPLLAVYAGYSLMGAHVSPGTALQPYVDDVVDEIEFVTGDTNTKWGAVRAKLGHPQPFPLHYVEIGNEDWFDKSGSYEGRYAQFYKALKAKYPQLQYIATTPVKSVRPDLIDDHYYKRADEFYIFNNHYDDADRSGPKIFVGEWATREGSPTTNLGAMLGDAAWMTAMERNSDLIVMASYAPLFVNVSPGGMQWESDLIGYDALSSYGSPSYYAQALFAEYLGTDVPTSTKSGGSDHFFYSATTDAGKGRLYLKLVNATSSPQAVTLHLNGAGKLAREANVETLTGSGTAETNSITDPKRIVPVRSKARISASFEHTIPPYALQVMEIETK